MYPFFLILLNGNITTIQAAEALGAISAESALPILREYLNDEERAVRETCEIAIDKIIWDHSEEGKTYHAKLEKDKEEEVPMCVYC